MTLSVPSFLQAATRPLMPPKADADVAVAALVEPELPPLDPPDDELLQPAASTTLLTAAAAMNNFLVGTCVSPPNRETTGGLRPSGAVDACIVTSRDVRSMTNSRAANGTPVKRSGQFRERSVMHGQPRTIGWMAPGRTGTWPGGHAGRSGAPAGLGELLHVRLAAIEPDPGGRGPAQCPQRQFRRVAGDRDHRRARLGGDPHLLVAGAGRPVVTDQLDPDRRPAEDEPGGPEPLPQRVGHARPDLAGLPAVRPTPDVFVVDEIL